MCSKAVLRKRDAIQMEYDMTLEELTRKKEEREQVSGKTTTFNPLRTDQRQLGCTFSLEHILF